MKAQKLIINGEEQNLSQVFSVNGQTGDVNIESGGLGYAEIIYDTDLGKWCLQQGELVDNTVCYFKGSPTYSTLVDEVIYSSDGAEEVAYIQHVYPDDVYCLDYITGLLKIIEVGGDMDMTFFVRNSSSLR